MTKPRHLFLASQRCEFKCSFALATYGLHAVEVAIVPYEPPSSPKTPYCTFGALDNLKNALLIIMIKGLMHYLFAHCARWLVGARVCTVGFLSHRHLDAIFKMGAMACVYFVCSREAEGMSLICCYCIRLSDP